MKSTVIIFFDTSALRTAGWQSAPLSTVLQLSKAGLVDVYVAELVAEERRTQWHEEPRKAVEGAKAALADFVDDPLLPGQHLATVKAALTALQAVDFDAISKDAVNNFISSNRLQHIPLTLEQAKTAWQSYFAGNPPHRLLKSRDDIPDAHIFAAGAELLQQTGSVHFVCGDKRLSAAFAKLPGATIHQSIEELFQSGALTEPRNLWKRDEIWQRIRHNCPMSAIEQEVRELLETRLNDELEGFEFQDLALPGEDKWAQVSWVSGGELIEISKPDDWGGGLMSFAISCETEAGIAMSATWDEFRSAPPVWTNIGWEGGRTLEASATVLLGVEGIVDVEVDLENAEFGREPILSKVALEPSSLRTIIINT